MALLTYNGQYVQKDGSYVNRPQQIIYGLLDFDGNDDHVSFSDEPDLSQDQRMTFKTYILNDSGYTTSSTEGLGMVTIRDGTSMFNASLKDSKFRVVIANAAASMWEVDLSNGYTNKVLEVDIRKYFDVFWKLDYVKINGVTVASESTPSGYSGSPLFRVGQASSPLSYLKDAYVWDVKVYNSSDTVIFQSQGQPSGNQDSAWDDTVGSLTATVSGSPTTIDLTV